MNTLPMLYKQSSKGADQQWRIWVEDNRIFTEWGQVGGQLQTSAPDVIAHGKNLGKKNATTPAEQALLEAKAEWEKKLKRGYVKSLADARKGKTDSVIQGGWWPMLAKVFENDGDKITWPAALQRKYNGHRMSAHVKNRKCTLWSRRRNLITGVPHINAALEKLVPDNGEYRFDGEGYNHAWHDNIEALSHFLRSETPEPGHEVVQYHVYDMNHPGTFQERLALRDRIFGAATIIGPLYAAETIIVSSEEEAQAFLKRVRKEKYEGGIVRNLHGLYKSVSATSRSDDLQKLKEWIDSEFKVVAITTGRGKDEGVAIFECELPDRSDTFTVKMKGSYEKQREYYENADRYIGKRLTVKYANLTKKTGKPFHPVAWQFSDPL